MRISEKMKDVIRNIVYDIFNEVIPLDEPEETAEIIIKRMRKEV